MKAGLCYVERHFFEPEKAGRIPIHKEIEARGGLNKHRLPRNTCVLNVFNCDNLSKSVSKKGTSRIAEASGHEVYHCEIDH